MKKLLTILLTSFMIMSLTGCSSSSEQSNAMEIYGADTLNVYNWGEYIGEDVISNFEDEYGVKVNYSLFDSNEVMYTKLQSGTKYDVLIPSDYMIERMIQEDLLQAINRDMITNFDQLDPAVVGLSYDVENQYSIPYFHGTVGIVYNKNNVDAATVEQQGFEVFRNEEFKGRVFAYDSERDSFMMALKSLGYSMNTVDETELNDAYQWLIDMDEKVEPSYVTDEVIDAMINGEKDIALVYSGDATYILSENEEMAYYAPIASGTNQWSDAMVIPANSEASKLANEFINYMISYDVAYANSEYVGYTSSNLQAKSDLSTGEGYYVGIDAYLPRVDAANDEIFEYVPEQVGIIADLWIKVKNN